MTDKDIWGNWRRLMTSPNLWDKDLMNLWGCCIQGRSPDNHKIYNWKVILIFRDIDFDGSWKTWSQEKIQQKMQCIINIYLESRGAEEVILVPINSKLVYGLRRE